MLFYVIKNSNAFSTLHNHAFIPAPEGKLKLNRALLGKTKTPVTKETRRKLKKNWILEKKGFH